MTPTYPLPQDFTADRTLPGGHYSLERVFPGIGASPALVQAIPDDTQRAHIIATTQVEIAIENVHYMRVAADDGRVMVGLLYLAEGPIVELYLDLVHELTHVRQFHEGLDLYDRSVSYVDRPTEIEAYAVAVTEARRIGYSDRDIHLYLDVHWVTEEERVRLATRLGVPPVASGSDGTVPASG